MIEIDFDFEDLERLREAVARAPEIVQDEFMRWGVETGARLQEQVIIRTPSRTGSLRNSIQQGLSVEPLGSLGVSALPGGIGNVQSMAAGIGVSIQIGSNEQYAPYVEIGTQPHTIRAKHAKALAFPGAGGTVFRREVNHPGTKPVRMFERALDENMGRVEASVRTLAERIIQRVFGDAS